MVSNAVRSVSRAAPSAAGGPGILLAMTVVLASAGVGYTASRIWPLSSLSGTAGQPPASERKASATWPAQPATAAPRPDTVTANPAPVPATAPPSRTAAVPAVAPPTQPEAEPTAATPEPLPTLALLPPSPAPLPEALAPAEPRISSDAAAGTQAAGKEESGKQEPARETGKQETRPANPAPPRANRPARPQRAAQPGPAPAEPETKNGYLQDKAMRDFMSYPTYSY